MFLNLSDLFGDNNVYLKDPCKSRIWVPRLSQAKGTKCPLGNDQQFIRYLPS